jgi:predicted DCC family thiol-disulfide oxidoreductase YuxK
MDEQDEINPGKPVMLWDGDCNFCFSWIQRWKKATGDAIQYFPWQEALHDFPQVDETACRTAVQLVMPDGSVRCAAQAVLTSLAVSGRLMWLLKLYDHSRFFRWLTEAAYRGIAANRSWLPH